MSREESANSHNSPPKKIENENNMENENSEIPAQYKKGIQKMIKKAMDDLSNKRSQSKALFVFFKDLSLNLNTTSEC